ncbi:MAG: hypothetical protein ABII90_07040 [Bacteroidota bacterium]
MEIKDIKQQISNLIEKILEHSKKINNSETPIPQEELDLILSDTRELYEKSVVLNYLNLQDKHVETLVETEKTGKDVDDEPQEQPSLTEDIISEEDEKNEQEAVIENHEPEKKPQIDLFSVDTKTLHEEVAKKQDVQTIGGKLEKTPISDLKTAIGVNERFLFINELFNGNKEDYGNSIDLLNKCKDLAEAKAHIDSELKEKYNWNEEDDTITAFLNLVERRFM